MMEFSEEPVEIHDKNIIFNKIVCQAGHFKNFICLLTKQYTYEQRCLGKDLNFHGFVKHVKRIQAIRNYNAQLLTKKQNIPKKRCLNDVKDVLQNDAIQEYIMDL